MLFVNIFVTLLCSIVCMIILMIIIESINKCIKMYHLTKDRKKAYSIINEMAVYKYEDDSYMIPSIVLNNANDLISKMTNIPYDISPTCRNSIQFEWEFDNGSYLELEIFKDSIVCLVVLCQDYTNASWYNFPITNTFINTKENSFEINIFSYNEINDIISNFLKTNHKKRKNA